MSDQVPFGKYKGRPVEEMLSDGSYMAWLEAQPWFRERFGHLKTAKDNDALSRTPVHNKLQTLFLDPAYRMAFLRVGAPSNLDRLTSDWRRSTTAEIAALTKSRSGLDECIAAVKSTIEGAPIPYAHFFSETPEQTLEFATAALPIVDALLRSLEGFPSLIETRATFESAGADVMIKTYQRYPTVRSIPSSSYHRDWAKAVFGAYEVSESSFSVEIKPTVADEYPAVLRQMNRNKSEFLFVGEYAGEGATEAQFVQIFAASGKKIVFKRDVDARLK